MDQFINNVGWKKFVGFLLAKLKKLNCCIRKVTLAETLDCLVSIPNLLRMLMYKVGYIRSI